MSDFRDDKIDTTGKRSEMTEIARVLSDLPKRKIKELETVTRRIVDTGKAEIVVLFGS